MLVFARLRDKAPFVAKGERGEVSVARSRTMHPVVLCFLFFFLPRQFASVHPVVHCRKAHISLVRVSNRAKTQPTVYSKVSHDGGFRYCLTRSQRRHQFSLLD